MATKLSVVHVYPTSKVGEVMEHLGIVSCPCEPTIEHEPERVVVRHHLWDGSASVGEE